MGQSPLANWRCFLQTPKSWWLSPALLPGCSCETPWALPRTGQGGRPPPSMYRWPQKPPDWTPPGPPPGPGPYCSVSRNPLLQAVSGVGSVLGGQLLCWSHTLAIAPLPGITTWLPAAEPPGKDPRDALTRTPVCTQLQHHPCIHVGSVPVGNWLLFEKSHSRCGPHPGHRVGEGSFYSVFKADC